MEKVILIKYGELTTKKGNRNFFVNTLYNNIKNKLKDYDVKISKDRARMYIEFNESELDSIKNVIDHIFGIHMYHIANIVDTNIDIIKSELLNIMKNENFNTFKVEVKRSDKSFPYRTMELNPILGTHLLKNIDNIKVDVHNPDILVKVEIREKHSYIYTNGYKGCGGYPAGVQNKAMLMLSGGIDSPVAGYLAMKRGIHLECIYFEAIPHTSIEARNKVISLARKLERYNSGGKLFVVNFTKIQEAIYKNLDPDYLITIMRRRMYEIAERIAKKNNCLAIVNGESVGQVASQTLSSMLAINSVTSFPIIRPVCCLDKLEIIDISKKIGTYETSILPFEDCCTIFLPRHPVIKPRLDKCIDIESRFDYQQLVDDCINNIETITIVNNYKNDLL